MRTAFVVVGTMLAFIIGTARFAWAAERVARRATPAVAGIAISGDLLKYGFVATCMVAGMVFKKDEPPILIETPGAERISPETLDAGESLGQPGPTSAAAAPPPEQAPVDASDDAALLGDLHARMQALVAERDAAANAPESDDVTSDEPPVSDSTDGWGDGNTAVLEPPRPDEPGNQSDEPRGLLDGEPSVSFPPGFPLVDGEVVEADDTPAASEEQIAMLKRMMGGAD